MSTNPKRHWNFEPNERAVTNFLLFFLFPNKLSKQTKRFVPFVLEGPKLSHTHSKRPSLTHSSCFSSQCGAQLRLLALFVSLRSVSLDGRLHSADGRKEFSPSLYSGGLPHSGTSNLCNSHVEIIQASNENWGLAEVQMPALPA